MGIRAELSDFYAESDDHLVYKIGEKTIMINKYGKKSIVPTHPYHIFFPINQRYSLGYFTEDYESRVLIFDTAGNEVKMLKNFFMGESELHYFYNIIYCSNFTYPSVFLLPVIYSDDIDKLGKEALIKPKLISVLADTVQEITLKSEKIYYFSSVDKIFDDYINIGYTGGINAVYELPDFEKRRDYWPSYYVDIYGTVYYDE